jgi:hypothetical protein
MKNACSVIDRRHWATLQRQQRRISPPVGGFIADRLPESTEPN